MRIYACCLDHDGPCGEILAVMEGTTPPPEEDHEIHKDLKKIMRDRTAALFSAVIYDVAYEVMKR